MRTLLLAVLLGASGCSGLVDRTLVNAGDEPVRLMLVERAEGYADYRSRVGPEDGLAPGRKWTISIDPDFENVLVVAAGERVVGEIPLPAGGPDLVEIDAGRLRSGP